MKGRSEQKFYKQSKDYKRARPVINQRALNYFCSTSGVGSGLVLSKIGHKTDVLPYWISNTPSYLKNASLYQPRAFARRSGLRSAKAGVGRVCVDCFLGYQ